MFCTRCGSQQQDDAAYCSQCGSPLDSQKPQGAGTAKMAEPAKVPATSSEANAPRQPITSTDQRTHPPRAEPETIGSSSKSRLAKLWIVGVLALVLGAGAYIIHSATQSDSPALSSERMSLPGISVAPPQGWTSFPVSQPGQLAMAPPGSGSCPANAPGGSLRCVEAVTLFRFSSNFSPGNDPEQALQVLANGRFNAIRSSLRQTTDLSQQSYTIGSCPAYKKEWHVSWSEAPDTFEGWVTVKTHTAYNNTYLAAVFIRLADSSNSSPQALMDAVISSIQCN
jgi:hypothetical protein